MALNSINTNIAAYFAQQNINSANNATSASIGRLSSGSRIVRAADDVAAMSVGTSLRTQVSTLRMGLLNASQGSSMLQVADGALSKVQDMLLRQKALATQATSGSLTATERGFLNQEFQNLTQEIDRVVQNTNFNGVNLLSGTLGSAASLAETDAAAGALAASANEGTIVSSTAIEVIDITAATSFDPAAAAAVQNEAQLVDIGGTKLADGAYLQANQSLSGRLGDFGVSNIIVGASATLTVNVNGVEYSGSFADGATDITLVNGNTRLQIGTAAFDLTTETSAQTSLTALNNDFQNTYIMHTSRVEGVDFTGTALDGVTFAAASGTPMIRTMDPSDVSVKNFEYVSNGGAADTNMLSVEVAGETWYTSANVLDSIVAGTVLTFTNGSQEALQIDLTGLTAATGNIRTDMTARNEVMAALNEGFANIGGGVDFALGTEATDKLSVSIAKSDTATLYGNQALNVSTVADAQAAGEALNVAINMVTSIRADVGALQSRFDFATANIEISLQNQDAARGTLLDTDIAAESSAYATSQVQLQAGIAVLAQANLLPQNLLKLIG